MSSSLSSFPTEYAVPSARRLDRLSRSGKIQESEALEQRLTGGSKSTASKIGFCNIGRQGAKVVRASSSDALSVASLGLNGNPYAEKKDLQHAF